LGGLSLTDLLKARAASNKQLVRDKSIIFLFLHGGPTQTETFDPKMSAPVEIRCATGEIGTRRLVPISPVALVAWQVTSMALLAWRGLGK
jgi:hypothetical protein